MGIMQRWGGGGGYILNLQGLKNVWERKIVAIVLFKALKNLKYNPPNKNICYGVRLEYGASYLARLIAMTLDH
jgi:hypothetical protein